MKLSTREDMAVPVEVAFDAISDFEEFERRAMRRGADVSRTDPPSGPGLGSTWDATFSFRGKQREIVAEMELFDPPNSILLRSRVGGLRAVFDVTLVALSPQKTRMVVGLEFTANNLSARLLVQSLKLAKAALSKRFERAVSEFAVGVERAHKGVQPGVTLG